MTVCCPSCNTRYRHEPSGGSTAATAWCSRCDERFPLVQAKRSYIVRPPVGSAEMPRPAEMPPAPATSLPHGPVESLAGQEPAAAPPPPDAAPVPPRRSVLVEFLAAAVPAAGGAAMAYHLAGRQGQDPLTWAALGGAIGLLLGWACLLWMGRTD